MGRFRKWLQEDCGDMDGHSYSNSDVDSFYFSAIPSKYKSSVKPVKSKFNPDKLFDTSISKYTKTKDKK